MDTAHYFVAVFLLSASVPLGIVCTVRACISVEDKRWVQMVALFLLAAVCVANVVTIIREFAT